MKTRALCLLLCALALLSSGTSAEAADRQVLTGIYHSGFQDRPQPLRAIFSANDDGTWDVDFEFKFGGRDHVYSGVADGSLTEGELAGRVRNEGGDRLFVFRVEFDGKKGKGRHAEVTGGREVDTGPLTLKH